MVVTLDRTKCFEHFSKYISGLSARSKLEIIHWSFPSYQSKLACDMVRPGIHFTIALWVCDWKLVKSLLAVILIFNDPFRWQCCTCHASWAVVACAKLWLDWIIMFHVRIIGSFFRFGLKAHKLLMTQAPDHWTRERLGRKMKMVVPHTRPNGWKDQNF